MPSLRNNIFPSCQIHPIEIPVYGFGQQNTEDSLLSPTDKCLPFQIPTSDRRIPNITQQRKIITTMIGDNVTLPCIVTSLFPVGPSYGTKNLKPVETYFSILMHMHSLELLV